MKKFLENIELNKKKYLIALVTLIILSILGILRIEIDSEFSNFMPSDSEYIEIYNNINEIFETDEQIFYLAKLDFDPKTISGIKKINEISNKLLIFEGIKYVNSPVQNDIIYGLNIINIKDINEDNLHIFLNYMDSFSELTPLVEENGFFYCPFIITPEKNADIDKVIVFTNKVFKDEKLDFYASGQIYLQRTIYGYIKYILFTLPPIALIIVLIIFIIQLGSLKSTLIALIPAVVSSIITLGLIGGIIKNLSIITSIIPLFTIVMGSADGLHFVSHVIDKLDEGKTKIEALYETFKIVGNPMIITTLTTVFSFLALTVIKSEAIFQLSILAAIGIALAGLSTWFLIPLLIFFCKDLKTKRNTSFNFLDKFFMCFQNKKSIFVVILLCSFFIPGIIKINTDFNLLKLHRPFTTVYKSNEQINKIYGSALPLLLLIESEIDPINTNNALEIINIQKEIEKIDGISKTVSGYDFIAIINKNAFNLDKIEYPRSILTINLIYNNLLNFKVNPLESFINREKKVSKILVYPPDISAKTLNQVENEINKIKHNYLSLSLTGVPLVMKEMNDRIFFDQMISIILASIIIFILMLIVQKNLKLAILSLLPLIVSLITLFGFMGYSGFELSLITSIISVIAIGVGIDYAIHFLSVYKSFYNETSDKEAALKKAFKYVSTPIIAHTLGLGLGFSTLLFSPLTSHVYFSVLMFISMTVCAFLSLTLIPYILSIIKIKK